MGTDTSKVPSVSALIITMVNAILCSPPQPFELGKKATRIAERATPGRSHGKNKDQKSCTESDLSAQIYNQKPQTSQRTDFEDWKLVRLTLNFQQNGSNVVHREDMTHLRVLKNECKGQKGVRLALSFKDDGSKAMYGTGHLSPNLGTRSDECTNGRS